MTIDFFWYAIIIFLIYIYCGVGLTFLVIPKRIEKYSLYFTPFIGLAYLSYCSWFFFEYSAWGTNEYSKILLIPPLFFLFFACIVKKDRIQVLFSPLKKENLAIIFLCIFLFLAISFPYYSRIEGISNTITLSCGDIIDYSAISKYLTLSSKMQSPIFYIPESTPHFPLLIQNGYFSAFLSTAFPCSLLNLESFQIQNLVIYLFFIFILPMSYLIGIEIFGYSKKIALLITFLIGINFHLYYIIYQGFLGQCIGMGFFLGLIFTTYYPILKYEKFFDIIIFLPLNVLFCFGLFLSYDVLVPFFIIPTILFISLYYIYSRSKQFFIQSMGYFCLTFFITFLISPFSSIPRFLRLIFYTDIVAGWDMPFLTPHRIFGIVGNNVQMQNESIFLIFILSLSIILLFIFSFYYLFYKERRNFILFGMYLGFIFIFYTYLTIKEFFSPGFSGDSYKAYKLLTYIIPIILLTSLYYFKIFELTYSKIKIGKKIIIIAFLCLLIIGSIWSAMVMISVSSTQSLPIEKNILDLQKIGYYDNISSINIEEKRWLEQMWMYYFLFTNKTVYLKYPTYFGASPQKGEWTLKYVGDIPSISLNDNNSIILLNDEYYLEKSHNTLNLEASLGEGWYFLESTGDLKWRWSGAENKSPSIILNLTQSQVLNLDLTYWSINPDNELTILVDNITIKECINHNQCRITNLNLTSGKHTLTLNSKLPPQLAGNGDGRYISYAFSNITFSSNV